MAFRWIFRQIMLFYLRTEVETKEDGKMSEARENPDFELILTNKVKQLLTHFANVMKIQAVFFGADGTLLERGRNDVSCPYCLSMRRDVFGPDACSRTDAENQKQSRNSDSPLCYRCHAGLNEIIAPVSIDGALAGYIMFGQFRTTDIPPESVWKHPDRERLMREFLAVPKISGKELEDFTGLFSMLLNYIVSRELVRLPGDRRFADIRRYLEKHLSSQLTLAETAKQVGMSVSGLTHYLRGKYHCSFKELLIEMRLKKAAEMLKNEKSRKISDIAAAVGYDDPHYFSRLFRKYRGISPSALRQ